MEEKKKGLSLIDLVLIILFIFVAFVSGYYLGFGEGKRREKDKKFDTVVNENVEYEDNLTLDLDEIVILVKDYYYKNNLVEKNNLSKWKINSSTLVGYYKDKKDIRFYLVEGKYSCIDKGNSCVYMDVADNPKEENEFKVYVAVDESDSKKVLKSIEQLAPSGDNFFDINKEVNNDETDMINKMNSGLRKFYENNNTLSDMNNLKDLSVKYVEYIDTEENNKQYVVVGTYSCKDETSDCLYFEQVGEPLADHSYDFNIIVSYDEKENVKILGSNTYYKVDYSIK